MLQDKENDDIMDNIVVFCKVSVKLYAEAKGNRNDCNFLHSIA